MIIRENTMIDREERRKIPYVIHTIERTSEYLLYSLTDHRNLIHQKKSPSDKNRLGIISIYLSISLFYIYKEECLSVCLSVCLFAMHSKTVQAIGSKSIQGSSSHSGEGRRPVFVKKYRSSSPKIASYFFDQSDCSFWHYH